VTDDWHVGATLKIPVYTHVQGGQLDVPGFVGVSAGMQIHLFDGSDDHRHHIDEHVESGNWSGLDMQSATDDGAAVPLVPVAGKITVFDFWATWCKPCGVLDRELAELVRRYPADLAVRKLNVVDEGSPASRSYVGASTLPHVKVFGRDGKLVFERSGAPLALVADVDKLVSGAPSRRSPIAGATRIEIEVTDAGYVPATIEITHGVPVTLVFTRKSATTCATDVHFVMPDNTRIDEELPLGKPVEIPISVERVGEITYSCGMNMNHGTIVVR